MVVLRCKECAKACAITTEDRSFSHEFGVERVMDVVSSCCGGPVLEFSSAAERWTGGRILSVGDLEKGGE